MSRFALIHSPFVGASCWREVADILTGMGQDASAMDYDGVRGPCWHGSAARRVARELGQGSAPIVVAHSAAGALVPAIVRALAPGGAAGVMFVDAVLPRPGRSWLDSAPSALAERLGVDESDDLLPPWNLWFERDPSQALIPDNIQRRRFIEALPRVARAYLSAPEPDIQDWRSAPAAYVRLSAAYEAEAREAHALGWVVEHLELGHLAMLSDPKSICGALMRVAGRLRRP